MKGITNLLHNYYGIALLLNYMYHTTWRIKYELPKYKLTLHFTALALQNCGP